MYINYEQGTHIVTIGCDKKKNQKQKQKQKLKTILLIFHC